MTEYLMVYFYDGATAISVDGCVVIEGNAVYLTILVNDSSTRTNYHVFDTDCVIGSFIPFPSRIRVSQSRLQRRSRVQLGVRMILLRRRQAVKFGMIQLSLV